VQVGKWGPVWDRVQRAGKQTGTDDAFKQRKITETAKETKDSTAPRPTLTGEKKEKSSGTKPLALMTIK